MPFPDEGFLSPTLKAWAENTRKAFADWFALADALNRDAVRLVPTAAPRRSSVQQVLGALLYGRALSSYEGVVLLVERGMIADARTLVRSCAESAIALGANAIDHNFVDVLVEAHYKHRVTVARVFLSRPPTQQDLNDAQLELLRKVVSEATELYPSTGPKSVVWANVADKAGMTTLYDTVYRDMSGDGAHATIEALNRQIVADTDSNIQSLTFAPQTQDLTDTISAAMSSMLHAMDALGLTLERQDIREIAKRHCATWSALKG